MTWLARYSGEVNGDDAAMEGTLSLEDKCFYVDYGRPTPALLIFPEDSSFDASRSVLTVLGKRFTVGGHFRSGGSGTDDLGKLRLLQPPDPSCDASFPWIVGYVD